MSDEFTSRVMRKLFDHEIERAIMGGTYTASDAPEPSLSADYVIAAWNELQALLPEVVYKTSDYTPKVDDDGKPVFFRLAARKSEWPELEMGLYMGELVVLHPDNLPLLQANAPGNYRLVPLADKQKQVQS